MFGIISMSPVGALKAIALESQPRPPSTAGPIIGSTADPVDKGVLEIQPFFSLGFTGGSFSPSWRRVSAGKDAVSLEVPVEFKYGLANNLEVRLVPSYLHNWVSSSNSESDRARSANFGGFGDMQLAFKYLLMQEGDLKPALSAQGAFTFPTGHHGHLNPDNLGTDQLGDGAYAFTLGLNATKYIQPFKLHANLRYGMSTTSRVDEIPVRARDLVRVNLAAEYPLGKGWVALLEGYSRWEVGTILGPRSTQWPAALVGFLPGIEYVLIPRWEFELGVAIDLVGKNTDFKYTPILTFTHKF
jgi:Putative MetA-pathway of phenol degradation